MCIRDRLSAFQSGVESRIQEAVSSRKALYRKLRTKPVMQDEEKQAEIKAEISALSGQLKELRREVRPVSYTHLDVYKRQCL